MIVEVTPRGLAPAFRHAASIMSATARAAKEFPGGVDSLRVLQAPELAKLAGQGVMLPASARVTVAAYRSVQAASRQRAMAKARRSQQRAAKAQAAAEEKRAAAQEERRKAKEAAKKAKRRDALRRSRQAVPEDARDVAPATQLQADDWESAAPW